MTLGGEPSTPLERAQWVANILGGNGLSQNQQVAMVAEALAKWSRTDCFEAAGIMDPLTKTPREVIEPLVWFRRDGANHGPGQTWQERAEELDKESQGTVNAFVAIWSLMRDDDRVPIETYQKATAIMDAWERE